MTNKNVEWTESLILYIRCIIPYFCLEIQRAFWEVQDEWVKFLSKTFVVIWRLIKNWFKILWGNILNPFLKSSKDDHRKGAQVIYWSYANLWQRGTLRFLINVLDQISVLVGNFVKMNKHTGPNKHTGAKLLAQKYNFVWI